MKRLAVVSIIIFAGLFNIGLKAQSSLKSIAVISLETSGISLDNLMMGNVVRLELEKTQQYEVLDKYDIANRLKDLNINPSEALGKSKLTVIGREVGADFMLSGSVQKLGNKIIYILRLVDVEQQKVIKSDVKEYIYDEQYLPIMTRLSLASLLGLEMNSEFAETLKSVERPIVSEGQQVKLSGPRFGMQFFSGDLAERISASEDQGGYNSSPYATVFAYQHEFQYVSSGEFQVLLETIIAINGIETKFASPSLTLLNGFRYKGWDLAFGPVFRFSRTNEGYFDLEGNWNIDMENIGENNKVTTIDKRGDLDLSTGLLVAVGRNFRSGHINLPVNFYYSHVPNLDSHVFGIMLGFNIAKSK
jgi:hypothetical protein